jgi:hypothetical protein
VVVEGDIEVRPKPMDGIIGTKQLVSFWDIQNRKPREKDGVNAQDNVGDPKPGQN